MRSLGKLMSGKSTRSYGKSGCFRETSQPPELTIKNADPENTHVDGPYFNDVNVLKSIPDTPTEFPLQFGFQTPCHY